jgi:hypothetical protein
MAGIETFNITLAQVCSMFHGTMVTVHGEDTRR